MSTEIIIPRSSYTRGQDDGLNLSGSRYVRLRELQTMVPFSVPTIWRKSRDGSFPPAIRLSPRITAWSRDAVEQWLKSKEHSL